MTSYMITIQVMLLRIAIGGLESSDEIVEIDQAMEFICGRREFSKFVNCATSLEALETIAKDKILRAPSDMNANEINSFFSNINAKHKGVLSEKGFIPPLDQPKKPTVLSHYSFARELAKRKIVIFGGCFNGFHKGHWATLHKIKTDILHPDIKLVVLLAPDSELTSKTDNKSLLLQNQKERLQVLENISTIDYIIPIPNKFKNYLQLINDLNAEMLFICRDGGNDATFEYYCYHQDALAKKHKKQVDIIILSCTYPEIHSSNFLNNKVDKHSAF